MDHTGMDMQRRTVLESLGVGALTMVSGCGGAVNAEWVPNLGIAPESKWVLVPSIVATGPVPGVATISVRHVQSPPCRFQTPECGQPQSVTRLQSETVTVSSGDTRTWQIPIDRSSAVDMFVVDVTTDNDATTLTAIDARDRSIVDESVDLTVPPTTDSVSADLVGPLSVGVTVEEAGD